MPNWRGFLIVTLALTPAAGAVDFAGEVWPILDQHCIRCHGEAKVEGELRLDSPEAIAAGGEFGAIIDHDSPLKSVILEMVTLPEDDPDRMPAKSNPLSEDDITVIRAWLEGGAATEGWTQELAAEANARATAYWAEKSMEVVKLPETFATDIEEITFNDHIRPILSNNCFACHGPDGAARKAGLRLDNEQDAFAPREDGPVIVPGDARASRLVKRIFHHDTEEVMPPPVFEKVLTDDEKNLIAAWIDAGAEYEPLWSYIKPQRSQITKAPGDTWSTNEIDILLSKTWAEKSIEPAQETDPVTLIRRLYYDLIGLPPTPEVVDAFVANPTREAYAKLRDDLLTMPQYGERMAIHWLDQVRYADSNGYHSDEERSVYPYRDYVIQAFNENKPYDEFTIEQLAGDLLPNPTREQLVATGFNRMNQITAEGGAQPKEYRAMYNADRVRALGSVWLGSTLGCVQCHDHKFDPYAIDDFYEFAAFFADVEETDVYPGRSLWEPILRLPTPEEEAEIARLESEIVALNTELTTADAEVKDRARAWLEGIDTSAETMDAQWLPLSPATMSSEKGATFEAQGDLTVLLTSRDAPQDVHEYVFETGLQNIKGLRFEAMSHDTFKTGLTREKNLAQLNEVEVFVRAPGADDFTPVEIRSARTDAGAGVPNTIDGDLTTNWRVSNNDNPRAPIAWIYRFGGPLPGGGGTQLKVRLHYLGEGGDDRSAFGRVRISATSANRPGLEQPMGPPESVLLAKRDGKPTDDLIESALPYYLTIDERGISLRNSIKTTQEQKQATINGAAYTLYTRTLETPRTTRVLPRGNWLDESGEIVEPAVPAFLPPLGVEDRRANRLDLAHSLVSEENPLTSRVFVNRLWRQFFGRGLSKTLDDLGNQGEPPMHPELLDWLAVEFMESGWDVQHMIRLITDSSAYRQSSEFDQAKNDRDPGNRFVARQARFRYNAEIVRDTALQISGLLNPEIGGPSVRPYQPEGYWENLNFPKRVYQADMNKEQYRRGLYVHWQRSFLHPSLMAFDAPSREECTAERATSNTPMQALTLLNDPTYVEASEAFATRIIAEGGLTPEARATWAMRQAVGRVPGEEEVAVLVELYEKHRNKFVSDQSSVESLLAIGMFAPPETLEAAEVAAWSSVARVILNLHETITRS